MKISVNDQELFNMSEIKKKVISNDIPAEVLENDLKRRVAYILAHKYERCMERLKREWIPKLKAAGVQNIPLDDDAFAQLVFARPEYKDRSARERDNAPSQEDYDKAMNNLASRVEGQLAGEVSKF